MLGLAVGADPDSNWWFTWGGYGLGVILAAGGSLLWMYALAPAWLYWRNRSRNAYCDFDRLLPFADLLGDHLIDRYGCVSLVAEIEAPTADVATIEQLHQLQNQLCQLLDRVPEPIVQLQFIYSTLGSYRSELEAHARLVSNWPVAQALRQLRSRRLLAESQERRLVRSNTLLVLTCAPRGETGEGQAIWSQLAIRSSEAPKLRQRILRPAEFAASSQSLKTAWEVSSDALQRVGVRLRRLGGKEIAGYYYRLFNPDLAIDQGLPLNFDPECTPFTDAWLCGDIQLQDNCLLWGSYYHAVVGMSSKPQQSSPRAIEALTTGLPFTDFRVSLQVRRLDKSVEIASLQQQRIVSVGKRRSSINPLDFVMRTETPAHLAAEENIEASDEVREQNELISELRAGKINLLQIQLVVHFWHPDRVELQRRREILLARFHDMNRARGWPEAASTLPVFLNSLPGCYLPFEHPCKVKDRMAADLIPLHKGFEGGGDPVALFRNATGGLVTLDLFNQQEVDASMAFVSGATGGGKSFLVNQLILQHLVGQPLVLIVDLGGSYGSLVRQMQGQMIEFDPMRPQCFNPLQVFHGGDADLEPDAAARGRMLVNLEAMLVQQGDAGGELSSNLRNLLDTALVQTFARAVSRREPTVTLSHLAERLRAFGTEGHELVDRLRPFLQGEVFGAWFDGPSTLDLSCPVVCFDLKGIKKLPILTRALIPMMVNYLHARVSGQPGTRKILLFEEMWEFISHPRVASFIVESYKTFRKEGAAVIGVSQSLSDVARNEVVASALMQNVQTWFLLDQGNAENERLAIQWLNLTDGQADILGSLQRASRKTGGRIELFRECLMIRGRGRTMTSGRIRIAPMPEEYWLATTRPEEITAREGAVRQHGGDLGQALECLARQHPTGLAELREA